MKAFKNIDFHEFVESLVKTIELKDIYTGGHSKRVSEIAELICYEMNMSKEECDYMHIAGHLHDIGKIGIPDGILLKTGKLSNAEYVIMQQHAVIGSSIFENLRGFEGMAAIIRHHHERFDGKGYPDRLKGDQIPLEAAIISIADAFDAMTTPRSYRAGMNPDAALEEIYINREKQFHPDLTEVFSSIFISNRAAIERITKEEKQGKMKPDYIPFNSILIDSESLLIE